MNTHRTAGAVLATLAALLLGACSDDSGASAGGPSPTPSDPSSISSSTTDDPSDYSILGPYTLTDLEPGRYAVTASGSRDVPLAVVELSGEGLNGGGGYIWTVGGAPENDGWIFGYWTVAGVYVNPCTRAGGTFDTKSSPDLFLEALAAQGITTTSHAKPVMLGGYDGIYVELTSPTALDYTTCREAGLTIFDSTTKGDQHLIVTPGAVERYWVLDVNGERVVLIGITTPETTDSQLEQLRGIVESVQFTNS